MRWGARPDLDVVTLLLARGADPGVNRASSWENEGMDRSLKAVDAIIECLRQHTGGFHDAEALAIIQSASTVITTEIDDTAERLRNFDTGYARELLHRIKEYADLLYSERKHEQHGGPGHVRSHVLAHASRLRQSLDTASQSK